MQWAVVGIKCILQYIEVTLLFFKFIEYSCTATTLMCKRGLFTLRWKAHVQLHFGYRNHVYSEWYLAQLTVVLSMCTFVFISLPECFHIGTFNLQGVYCNISMVPVAICFQRFIDWPLTTVYNRLDPNQNRVSDTIMFEF